ncbi:hypothetical protein BC937DRAFT_94753 [Endogone sp. FLAS-F59071]|nr:hypothetical protein BC937DRAFT_94753 [Endogone sp. FLAS-F59071]|eukprot:RUS13802.1 hypothetical protein BC937DRAFT_94753 [Endogone sp. FLAS-F59071]
MSHAPIDITIIGGGLTGLNCAYMLHKRMPNKTITVLEKGERVIGLTSATSTGGFRNFFQNSRPMTNLANRSIDLLAEYAAASRGTRHEFMMNQCGYIFLSAQSDQIERYKKQAEAAKDCGSGDIRYNGHPYNPADPNEDYSSENFNFELYKTYQDGIDLIDDPAVILKLVPDCVNKEVRCMFHVRKAGYLDVEGLGEHTCHEPTQTSPCDAYNFNTREFLLNILESFPNITILTDATVTAINYTIENNTRHVSSVEIRDQDGVEKEIKTRSVVMCPGPYLKQVGEMAGVDFPVINEIHGKAIISDPDGLIPPAPEAPFLFWSDPITISITPEERELIRANPERYGYLERPIGTGLHVRPLSGRDNDRAGQGRKFVGIWTYDLTFTTLTPPPFPPKLTPLYAPIVLRGLTSMIPSVSTYAQPSSPSAKHPLDLHSTRVSIYAGYYCKTSRNLPIIGPITRLGSGQRVGARVSGLFVCAAFSGFGVMNGPGLAEVLAGHVEGWVRAAEAEVPWYASEFSLERVREMDIGFGGENVKEGQL